MQRHAANLEKAQRQAGVQYSVASVLAASQSWHDAIAGCFAAICQHLHFCVAALLEIDAETGRASCRAAWTSGEPRFEAFVEHVRGVAIDVSQEPLGHVWRNTEPYATADIGAVPDFPKALQAQAAGLHAAVFVPVVSHDARFGVLELFAESAEEPDVELVQTLKAIGAQIGQAMVRRKQHISIQRLNRVYAVLSGVNSLIVRVRDRAELFREACRIAVEDGKFQKGWIGILEGKPLHLRLAEYGGDPVYFEKLRDTLSGLVPDDHMPFLLKLRAGEPLVFNDVTQERSMLLKDDLLASGSRAVVWLPLIVSGELAGVLVLHADETGFFDADEIRLLLELAGDVAFALEHITKTDRLDYLAYFDALTGLANATLFVERVDQRCCSGGERTRFALAGQCFAIQGHQQCVRETDGDGLLKQISPAADAWTIQ